MTIYKDLQRQKTTLKTCCQCRFFMSIGFVYPESIAHTRGGTPCGYYVQCGKNVYKPAASILIHGAIGEDDLFCDNYNYKALERFLKFNASCRVECPSQAAHRAEVDRKFEQITFKSLI